MKKIVSLFLLIILVVGLIFCFVACGGGSSSSSSGSSSYTPSYSSKKTLTVNEKKELAEQAALRKINSVYPFSMDGTRYKIGTIGTGRSDGKVAVNGQLYTYDRYGNFEDSYTFTVLVSFDDNGNATAERFDYKIQ